MEPESPSYQWYTQPQSSAPILQGDFVFACPVIVPPPELGSNKNTEVDIKEYDVIVMSQSCDLVEDKLDIVLVCPVWTYKEVCRQEEFFKSKDGKKALKQGNAPGYHLLNKQRISAQREDFLVVDFRNVYGVDCGFLRSFIRRQPSRLRLEPPYREQLSQAFARFFMRVGLPVDIPDFI